MEFACKQDLRICPVARKYDKPFVSHRSFLLSSPRLSFSFNSLYVTLPPPVLHLPDGYTVVFMKRKTVKKLAKRILKLNHRGRIRPKSDERLPARNCLVSVLVDYARLLYNIVRNTIFLIHLFYRISSTHLARSRKLNIRSRLSCSADSRIISQARRDYPWWTAIYFLIPAAP